MVAISQEEGSSPVHKVQKIVHKNDEDCLTPKYDEPQGRTEFREKVEVDDLNFLHVLGTGSYGPVKCARWKDGNRYAVKIMSKQAIFLKHKVAQINRERELLLRLEFPFIASTLATFKDNDNLYIVMECAAGGTIFSHLSYLGRFSMTHARFNAAQVALALVYLHSRNIAHRDLKPENVILSKGGYCKMIDFGLAKCLEPGSRTYTAVGTPEYVAPEVFLNKGHGKPVDWWALGVMVYEMIVGRVPFYSEDRLEVFKMAIEGRVSYPKKYFKEDRRRASQSKAGSTSKEFIENLLLMDPDSRPTESSILHDKWFASVSWEDVMAKRIAAPYRLVDLQLSAPQRETEEKLELPYIKPPSIDPFTHW